MQFSAIELAALLEGKVEGNPSITVHNIAKIEEGQTGDLSFIANPKYVPFAYTTQASILLVSDDLVLTEKIQPTLIRVKDPYAAFTILLQKYNELIGKKTGIEQPSFVSPSAKLGENVYIGAFAYIGKNVTIGNHVQIYPQAYIGDNVTIEEHTRIDSGVKIYRDCQIGKHCHIQAGSIIGSDGFGFAPQADGSFQKIPQIGKVVLEDFVDIGANTTIDRATMGITLVKQGVKLDNLIQVAHNVEIGENTVMAAQVGIAGSTKIGKQCMIGGQVGFAGHIKVAEGTKIQAQSGIGGHVKKPNKVLMGTPAFDFRQHMKAQVVFKKLPDIYKKISQLEKEINKSKA